MNFDRRCKVRNKSNVQRETKEQRGVSTASIGPILLSFWGFGVWGLEAMERGLGVGTLLGLWRGSAILVWWRPLHWRGKSDPAKSWYLNGDEKRR